MTNRQRSPNRAGAVCTTLGHSIFSRSGVSSWPPWRSSFSRSRAASAWASIGVGVRSRRIGHPSARWWRPRSHLLAFMLAFTFGLAASRFDVRRGLVIDEANAIGTTYLRAGLLPEPHRSDVRSLLREYVDVRLEAVQPGKLSQSIGRSEELHARLWAHAVAVGEKNPGSIVVGLFIASLNEVIDLHAKRLALGVRNRIPGTIWAALYFVAIIGTSVMGYHAGLAGSGRSLALSRSSSRSRRS